MSSKAMQDLEQALAYSIKKHANPTGLVNKNPKGQGYVKERQYVRLKVRLLHGGAAHGPVQDFEFYSTELSALGAECEAKKAAKKAGWVFWLTAENHRVEVQSDRG